MAAGRASEIALKASERSREDLLNANFHTKISHFPSPKDIPSPIVRPPEGHIEQIILSPGLIFSILWFVDHSSSSG